MSGGTPYRTLRDIARAAPGLTRRADIEAALDEIEYLFEVISPVMEECVKRVIASLCGKRAAATDWAWISRARMCGKDGAVMSTGLCVCVVVDTGSMDWLASRQSKPGIPYLPTFRVTRSKAVPALHPESDEFVAMPEVFATGSLADFLECACIKALNSHLKWPRNSRSGRYRCQP